jgi:hypothetical protein
MKALPRPLLARIKAPEPAQNLAEVLCALGWVLRRRLQRDQGRKTALPIFERLRWDSKLALQFVNLRAAVQFSAMVEDWPVRRIQEAVVLQRLKSLRSGGGPH